VGLVPIFRGRVNEQGTKIVLFDTERAWRRAHLYTLRGQDVEVIVRKKRRQRSTEQNAYIHVAAAFLAEEFGNEIDEMKLILMGEKWGWHRDKATGREVPIKPHTSDMTVEEATEFIDWLPRWALGHNITLPSPGEVTQ
jgi:hypothetical protein